MPDWLQIIRGEALLIVSMPHTGAEIPADLERRFVSPWLARKDSDWWVEQLYDFAPGLGATVVPRPRQPLLDAYAVREVLLGRRGPTRQISLVRRNADVDNRNIDALFDAFACAYASNAPRAMKRATS